MASVSMSMTSLFGAAKQVPSGGRRSAVAVRASSSSSAASEKAAVQEERNSRRGLVLGVVAAAAAAASVAGVAMADEPKRGTPDAKKKYAPICVTMPTARICRN